MKIRKGDIVMVISGKDKSKKGKVESVLATKNQLIVEGINLVKKHQKNRRTKSQGQIIEKSMPIDASNVSLLEGNKAVRVGYIFEGEGKKRKKVRVARPSGKKI